MIWGNLDKRDVQVASAIGAAAFVALLLFGSFLWGDFENGGAMWLIYPFFGLPASFAINMLLLIAYERVLAPILRLGEFSTILLGTVGAFAIALISFSGGVVSANDVLMAALAAIGSCVAFRAYLSIAARSPAGASGSAEKEEPSGVSVVSHLAAFLSALSGVAALYAIGTAVSGSVPDQILGHIFWGSAVPYLFLIALMYGLEFYQRGRKPLADKSVISIAMSVSAVLTAALLSWAAANSSPKDPAAAAILVVAAVVIAALTTSMAFRLHLRFR